MAMKRQILKSCGAGSPWNDPGQLLLKVALALTYFIGLVAFERYTSLLDLPPDPGNFYVRLPRSLLSLENTTLATVLNNTKTTTELISNEEEVAQDPLFPKDLFTMKQIK